MSLSQYKVSNAPTTAISLLLVFYISWQKANRHIIMGRKPLTLQERIALAHKQGFSTQSTSDRQDLLRRVEQSPLADSTEEKHTDASKLWQEYVNNKVYTLSHLERI